MQRGVQRVGARQRLGGHEARQQHPDPGRAEGRGQGVQHRQPQQHRRRRGPRRHAGREQRRHRRAGRQIDADAARGAGPVEQRARQRTDRETRRHGREGDPAGQRRRAERRQRVQHDRQREHPSRQPRQPRRRQQRRHVRPTQQARVGQGGLGRSRAALRAVPGQDVVPRGEEAPGNPAGRTAPRRANAGIICPTFPIWPPHRWSIEGTVSGFLTEGKPDRPTDADIYPTKSWTKDALVQPAPRQAYQRLLAHGWIGALRIRRPDETIYTFWDYKRDRWRRDAGLRIDHILLTPAFRPQFRRLGLIGVFGDGRLPSIMRPFG